MESMRFFLVFFSIIFSTTAFTNNNIDSLTHSFAGGTDSVKYLSAIKLGMAYESVNKDSSFHYYQNAISLAKENEWHKKVGDAYFNLSFFYHYKLREDTSLAVLTEASTWYDKANYSYGVLNSLFTLGTYWMNFENLDSAILYLEKSAIYGEEINDTVFLHKIYNNLGLGYQYAGNLEKAIDNMLLCISEKEKYSPEELYSAYINLGLSYLNTGEAKNAIKYSKLGYYSSAEQNVPLAEGLALKNIGEAFAGSEEFDSAFYYYVWAKKVFLDINDSNHLSRYYLSMSEILEAQGLSQQASDSMQMALNYFPYNGSPRLRVHILTRQCVFKLAKNPTVSEQKEVEKWALEANQIAQEIGLKKEVSTTAKILFNLYNERGQKEHALKYASAYISIQDSLFNEQQTDALAEQRTKFETEKKELEIEFLNTENRLKSSEIAQGVQLQKKQKTIIYLLMVGFVIILVFIGVVLKLNVKQNETNTKLKQTNKVVLKQKEEKEVLLKEIHHRVKNNLQIVWSLLDLQSNSLGDEQIKLAINDGKNRVNSMALIHTMLYQNDDAGNISFRDYINKLVAHIKSTHAIVSVVEVDVDIPSSLKFDIDTSIPLGLIVTELFTNALKYGVIEGKPGCIKIAISPLGENHFELLVKDDGPGFSEAFNPKKSTSLGLKLVPNLCKQIHGSVDMKTNNGAEISIKFKGESFKIA